MSFNRPLNHYQNEIRVVNILDTPAGGDEAGYIAPLSMSLNDFTTFYQHFVTNKSVSDPNTTKDWIYQTGTLDPALQTDRPQDLSLPLWQLTEDYPDGNSHLPALAVGTFPPSKLSPIPIPLRLELAGDEDEPLVTEPPNPRQTFSALPRFTWGDFEATSYCWESEEHERVIVLDNQEIPVPMNLEAALQATRDLPERNHGMKFWADHLCINQDDTQEKNHQVKLMQSIYTKAFTIVVWLGPEIDESEQAIDLLILVAPYNWDDDQYWKRERTPSSMFDGWFKEVP